MRPPNPTPPALTDEAVKYRSEWPFHTWCGVAGETYGLPVGCIWPDGGAGATIEAALPEPFGDLFESYVEQQKRWAPASRPPEGGYLFPSHGWTRYLEWGGTEVEYVAANEPPGIAVQLQARVERRAEEIAETLETLFAEVANVLRVVVAEIETGTGTHPIMTFDPARSLRPFRAEVRSLWEGLQQGQPADAVLGSFDALADGWGLLKAPWAQQRSLLEWRLDARDGWLMELRRLLREWVSYELALRGAAQDKVGGRKPRRMSDDTQKVLFVARRVFGERVPEDWRTVTEMRAALGTEVNRLGKPGDDFLNSTFREHVGYVGEASGRPSSFVRLINAKAAEVEAEIGQEAARRLATRPW